MAKDKKTTITDMPVIILLFEGFSYGF